MLYHATTLKFTSGRQVSPANFTCARPHITLCCCTPKRYRDEETLPGFTDKYEKAMTISELYSIERPPPIPLAEHEQRRKKRDIQEIVEAASRRGKKEQAVRDKLRQLESLLPDIINLHKLKASDWVTVLDDVDEVATKLVALKTVFPRANVFKVVSRLPRILLKATVQVQNDAEQSRSMLSSLPDPDSIIETVPDLVDPLALSRALATLKATLPGQNPLQVLQKSPEVAYSLGGEADIQDSAEYGEITTNI